MQATAKLMPIDLLLLISPFTCLTDRPDVPTISNTQTTVPRCNVTLKWTRPASNDCPILFYTVHYRQKESRQVTDDWITTNVTDPNANQQALVLKCTTAYEFEVMAWNVLGSSGSPSKAWPITTGGGQKQGDYSEGTAFSGNELKLKINYRDDISV